MGDFDGNIRVAVGLQLEGGGGDDRGLVCLVEDGNHPVVLGAAHL